MRQLLIATHNPHKTREIAAMLGAEFSVSDLTAHPEVPTTIESWATFEENARLKAIEASRYFTGLVLADDSGLEVEALGGAPGVRSARYAGEKATDAENCSHLLSELARVNAPGPARSARFQCVMVLAEKENVLATFHGTVEGAIIHQPRGKQGFGYDPLFVPAGHDQTFAQMLGEIKNRESHRARALAQLLRFLQERVAEKKSYGCEAPLA